MTNMKLTAGRYTVCTDTNTADDTTYQNWRTFKLTRSGKGTYDMTVLSNKEGNGQTWDAIGTIENNRLMVTDYAAHATPFSFDSLLLTCVSLFGSLKCADSNVKVPGTFPGARVWKIKKGSKTTAAPSLLRPTEVRDRNLNMARTNANERFASLMAMGQAKSDTQMNPNHCVMGRMVKSVFHPYAGLKFSG